MSAYLLEREVPFSAGERVVCRNSSGYLFTEGKEYEVVEMIPPTPMENGFTFPAYVVVTNDNGRLSHCHAHRFVRRTE